MSPENAQCEPPNVEFSDKQMALPYAVGLWVEQPLGHFASILNSRVLFQLLTVSWAFSYRLRFSSLFSELCFRISITDLQWFVNSSLPSTACRINGQVGLRLETSSTLSTLPCKAAHGANLVYLLGPPYLMSPSQAVTSALTDSRHFAALKKRGQSPFCFLCRRFWTWGLLAPRCLSSRVIEN